MSLPAASLLWFGNSLHSLGTDARKDLSLSVPCCIFNIILVSRKRCNCMMWWCWIKYIELDWIKHCLFEHLWDLWSHTHLYTNTWYLYGQYRYNFDIVNIDQIHYVMFSFSISVFRSTNCIMLIDVLDSIMKWQ